VLLVLPLRRKSELESSMAPYKVFVLATASIEVLKREKESQGTADVRVLHGEPAANDACIRSCRVV